jgi:hypothetical protein
MRHEGKPPARASNGGTGYIGSLVVERMFGRRRPGRGRPSRLQPYNKQLGVACIPILAERSQNHQSFLRGDTSHEVETSTGGDGVAREQKPWEGGLADQEIEVQRRSRWDTRSPELRTVVVGTGSGLPNSRSGHASQFAPLAFDGMCGRQ